MPTMCQWFKNTGGYGSKRKAVKRNCHLKFKLKECYRVRKHDCETDLRMLRQERA
jgi:hypothetical protein